MGKKMISRVKLCALRHACVLAACAAITVSCASAPSSVSPQQKAEIDSRQRVYMAHLREEGYAPSIDKDGDIAFKREGYSYFVVIGKSDPAFLYVLLPNIKSLGSDADRRRAADAVSYANNKTKVAKAYFSGSQNQYVSIGAEIFLENPDHFAVLFRRLIGTIDRAKINLESSW